MCVICKMGEIVDQLVGLAVRESKKDEKERSLQAVAAGLLVQAAQAALSSEYGLAAEQIEKAQMAIDEALGVDECSNCDNPDCPRGIKENGNEQPN